MPSARIWIAFVVALLLAGCGEGDPATGQPAGAAPGAAGEGFGEPPLPEGDPIAEADRFIAEKAIDRSQPGWKTRLPKPPVFGYPKDKRVLWVLDTNKGRITAELWPGVARHHVSSVVYLTRLGFYEGLKFHRVIQGFMAQGGDPLGSGGGSTGYSLPLEAKRLVKHDRAGILSAARTSDPNSANSQFFITFRPQPGLDVGGMPGSAGYTVFGAVVDGMGAVQALEAAGAPRDPGTPREPLWIEKAYVQVK